jgi:RecB family exonuclease
VNATHDRLIAARDFLARFSDREVLVIASTRIAADEFVRRYCAWRGGILGVHRFTLPELAFMLAAEHLAAAGKSFLTGVAMDAIAARCVHSCSLKWFEPVARTPGFFHALASTLAELRLNDIGPDALRGRGDAGDDMAALLEQFDRNLKDGEVADLAAAYRIAIEVIHGSRFRFRGCPLVLLDIAPTSHLESEVLRALGEAASDRYATTAVGDQAAIPSRSIDHVPTALERLREYIFEPAAPAGEMDVTVEFLSATDESRECVEIVRSALALAKSGIRFDEMAIVLRNPDTYQALVEDALRRAGIGGHFTLGSRRPNIAGRALLALLACASENLSASRFSEYLSLGQVPRVSGQGDLFSEDTSPATPYQWEKLLVDAAVIGGRDRWIRRLDGLHNELKKQIAEVQAEEDALRQHLERQMERLSNLRRFALPLIESLSKLPQHAVWGEWLEALEALSVQAIRRPEFILAVLAELRPMSSLGPVSLEEVQEVLRHRLMFLRTEPSERRYGKIFVTTTAELAGLSFAVAFLPGLAEDIFPRRAFEDPLLPDELRRSISSRLDTQDTRIARERLLLQTAAAAATSKFWVSYPRMDAGQGRPRSPSFYALDVLRAITGRVPDLAELQQRSTASVQSLVGWPAPRAAATAIDDAEYDLAVISGLLRLSPDEARGRARYLITESPALARSLRARSARWKARWSESDGVVPSNPRILEVLETQKLGSRPYSATALQHFAACPYRFLLHAIHRLQPREETVAIERIDPLTRGSLFHAAQFALLSELRASKLLPVDADNLASVLAVADSIFDKVAASYREDLAPAIPRVWESQIEDIRWDLRGWLRQMAEPANRGWIPAWFELSFGLPPAREKDPSSSATAVSLEGRLRLRGAIDLVEVSSDPSPEGSRIRITDHKTGKAPSQRPGITGHGEILQPLLYAEAAEVLLGKPAASSRLWYCTERGGYQIHEISVDEHSRASLARVLDLIDRSIRAGFLAAAPREGACLYCDYRLVCGPYEETRIRRKSGSDIAALKELREIP